MPRSLIWTPSSGSPVDLNDRVHTFLLRGMIGHRMPPIDISSSELPSYQGSLLETKRYKERTLAIPWALLGDNYTDFSRRFRQITKQLTLSGGIGQLDFSMPDGSKRYIRGIFKDGLDGGDSKFGDNQVLKTVLTFLCFDPFFYDNTEITGVVTAGYTLLPFFPILPFLLAKAGTFSSDSIDNPGDWDAYPTWTVQGPGTTIIIENLTYGELLQVNVTLSDTDVLEIISAPDEKDVLLNGVSSMDLLSDDSQFFALRPGNNDIEFSATLPGASTEFGYTVRVPYFGV